jgi:hypothetical protein
MRTCRAIAAVKNTIIGHDAILKVAQKNSRFDNVHII